METESLLSLLDHLEDNVDELEESLEPLLATALLATTKKLPVLDKAKLYVLMVYSIESLLFSYLRLNGVAAKAHPVFQELTRVKQYFAKIKLAETGPEQPAVTLNKAAAGRVIRHALAGNDLQRAEREARERVLVRRKVHTRFEEEVPEVKGIKRKVGSEEGNEGEVSSSSSSSSSEDEDGEVVEKGEGYMEGRKKSHRRKQKDLKKAKMIAEGTWVDKEAKWEETGEGPKEKKKRRKKRKKSGVTEVQGASSSPPGQGRTGTTSGEGNGKGKSK